MACDPLALAQAASCLQACVNAGMADAIKIYLLAQIAGVDPDPGALMKNAGCISSCIPAGAMPAVQANLLCQIAAGGGGGGGNFPLEWTPSAVDIGPWFGLQAFADNPTFPGVTSMTFKMTSMEENIGIEFAGDLLSIEFSNLATYSPAAGLFIDTNPVLTTISFPALIDLPTGCYIANNPALTSLSFPVLVPTNNTTHTISGNALTAASVNAILARFVANAGCVAGTLSLNGGTNAAPTGQGILDKATLIGRGMTVQTN